MPTSESTIELFSLGGSDGFLRKVNAAFARLLGRTPDEVSRMSVLELIHPEDIPATVAGIAALHRGDPEVLFENRFLQPDGSTVWLQWVARPIAGTNEWWASGRNVSELRRLLATAGDHVARLEVAVRGTPAGSWQLDLRSGHFTVDTAVLALLPVGRSTELSVDDLAVGVDEGDRNALAAAVERLRTDPSPTASIEVPLGVGEDPGRRHLSPLGKTVERDRRGRPLRAVGVLIDVTAEKAMEEHLLRLAMSDPLTGLANRRAFDQALRTELRRAGRAGQVVSLLMIDIDHFKRFNDTYGHLVGDDVLCLVARALTGAAVRAGDLVSRFGGEEFAVILPDTGPAAAAEVGARMLDVVRAVRLRQAPEASITASIGCATETPAGGKVRSADLVAHADTALYAAKQAGRDRFTAA